MANINDVIDVLCDGGKLSTIIENYKQRDGQLEIAKTINDAYENKETVLVNAPTGNGKSIACLVPAILNKAKGKTIISTATKTLQSQYENKDIPMLHKILNFNSHIQKGRDNYVCLSKYYEICDTFSFDVKQSFDKWLSMTQNGDLETIDFVLPQMTKNKICSNSDDCLESECPYKDKCFYMKNRKKAITSDVLVINHDLLALYLLLKERNVSLFGDAYSIIIDEAHKFEEIMTKYLGYRLDVRACKNFVNNAISYLDRCLEKHFIQSKRYEYITTTLNIILENTKLLFKNFIRKEDITFRINSKNLDMDLCENILTMVHKIYNEFNNMSDNFTDVSDIKIRKKYESILNKSQSLIQIFTLLKDIDSKKYSYCYYVDSCDELFDIKLFVSPIDISNMTNKMLFNRTFETDDSLSTVTLMSATLSVNKRFDFVKKSLGIDDRYTDTNELCLKELIIKEMFDYKHSCLLYIPKGVIEPTNTLGDKTVFTRQIIDTILEVDKIVDGGILSLFTSYSEMDKVYDGVFGNTDRYLINQITTSRQKALSDFKQNEEAIFFGTKTYWEGVDIQGKACSCVLIDRIPFPVPNDPIIEAKIDKIKKENGNWFDDFYLPIAIISLQQGFGRLIRTHKDLGMVVLMDTRILTKPYGRKILRSLPNCIKTRDMDKVKFFWDIVKQKRMLRERNE